MSEYELRDLMFTQNGLIAEQFQFWMTVTFAVVVVSYTAGERLAVWSRTCIAALYIAAAVTFYLRYLGAVLVLRDLEAQLYAQIRSVPYPESLPIIVGSLRHAVIIGGTLLAVILILRPTIGHLRPVKSAALYSSDIE